MAVRYRISVLRKILMNLTLTIPFGCVGRDGSAILEALIGAADPVALESR
jgi:hypothetical protein